MFLRPFAPLLVAASALPAFAAVAYASAAEKPSYPGSYVLTSAGGAGVRRVTLELMPSGEVSMRTRFSAKTGRPVEMAAMPPVVEKGTWHRVGSRAVIHIAETSGPTNQLPENQRPIFRDLTFSLHGCRLELIGDDPNGSAVDHPVEFDKTGCIGY